jgi:4-carboxymuconolactone decarboxylase
MTTESNKRSPRLAPVSAPDEEQQAALAKAPTLPDGTVRNIFLTLAHHPLLLKRFNAFAGTFIRFGKVPADERELVILRVGKRADAAYELGQHLPIARGAGLSDATIDAVLADPPGDALTAWERELVNFTDRLLDTGDVDDAAWTALADRYDEAQQVELLCLVGFYRMVADFLNVAGVELEDDMEVRE